MATAAVMAVVATAMAAVEEEAARKNKYDLRRGHRCHSTRQSATVAATPIEAATIPATTAAHKCDHLSVQSMRRR